MNISKRFRLICCQSIRCTVKTLNCAVKISLLVHIQVDISSNSFEVPLFFPTGIEFTIAQLDISDHKIIGRTSGKGVFLSTDYM